MEPIILMILKVCKTTNDCLIEETCGENKRYCIVHPERQDDKVWLPTNPEALTKSEDWVDWNKPLDEMGGLSMNDIMIL